MNSATTTTQPYTLAGRPVALVDRMARKAVLNLLGRIRHGRLIVEEDDHSFSFGDGQSSLQARIRIHAPQAYRRILVGGSIGAGEAYIEKLWDTDDLTVLAKASGGYPLGMRETAQRLLKRNEEEADRFSPEGGASSWEPI